MTYRTQRVEDDGVKRPRRTRHAQYLTHACEARTSIISEILRGAPQAPPGPKRLCAAPTNLHSKPARPDAAAMRNGVEGVGDDRESRVPTHRRCTAQLRASRGAMRTRTPRLSRVRGHVGSSGRRAPTPANAVARRCSAWSRAAQRLHRARAREGSAWGHMRAGVHGVVFLMAIARVGKGPCAPRGIFATDSGRMFRKPYFFCQGFGPLDHETVFFIR